MATPSVRPIGSVLEDLAGNLQNILRGEIRLARTELASDIAILKRSVMFLGLATVLAVLGVAYLLLASVFALALLLPLWAAALIVATVVLGGAAGCAMTGVKEIRRVRGMPRTVASIQETYQ